MQCIAWLPVNDNLSASKQSLLALKFTPMPIPHNILRDQYLGSSSPMSLAFAIGNAALLAIY